MTIVGLIAFVTGVLGVWLTIRQNIACWPLALISVVTSGIEFYNARLFGDMSLQVFYFFAGVYGWIYWKENAAKTFRVTRTPLAWWIALVAICAVLTVVCYFILSHFGGDKPLGDAALTSGSLVATYMMTRKWLENWAAWVVIDGAYIFLYLVKDMWIFALLYLFFTAMAAYGFWKWRKTMYTA